MTKPSGSYAVMAQRREPPDSLELFPTPPWATRALVTHVLGDVSDQTCWEPAAGLGHMGRVLAESFTSVHMTDVFDYGGLDGVGSFVGVGPDVVEGPRNRPDWIITNPPFNLAVEFVERALDEALVGVAVLVRTAWLEGVERHELIFRTHPPAVVAPFVERVPMVKGKWDPDASTATAYAWFVWRRMYGRLTPWARETKLDWIPPGCRVALTKPGDRTKFAAPNDEAEIEPDMFDAALA